MQRQCDSKIKATKVLSYLILRSKSLKSPEQFLFSRYEKTMRKLSTLVMAFQVLPAVEEGHSALRQYRNNSSP